MFNRLWIFPIVILALSNRLLLVQQAPREDSTGAARWSQLVEGAFGIKQQDFEQSGLHLLTERQLSELISNALKGQADQ